MRTVSLLSPLLALALLIQAAAAYGAMPCEGSGHADMHPSAPSHTVSHTDDHHGVHAAHSGHAPIPEAGHDAGMPCCDEDGTSACIASGHCLSASPLLPFPALAILPFDGQSRIISEADWLPPYGAPSGTPLRPPIA